MEQNGVKMGKRNNDGVVRAWGSREGADSAPGWWENMRKSGRKGGEGPDFQRQAGGQLTCPDA